MLFVVHVCLSCVYCLSCLSCHLHCCQCVIFVSGVSYVLVTVHVVLLPHCSAQVGRLVCSSGGAAAGEGAAARPSQTDHGSAGGKDEDSQPSSLSVAEKVSRGSTADGDVRSGVDHYTVVRTYIHT